MAAVAIRNPAERFPVGRRQSVTVAGTKPGSTSKNPPHPGYMHATLPLRHCCIIAACFALASTSSGDSSAWWSDGDHPLIAGGEKNNHDPANIGQAKHMVKSALDIPLHETIGIGAEFPRDTVEPVNEWSALKRDLEREIVDELPSVSADAMSAYDEARRVEVDALAALAEAEKNLKRIGKAAGLVDHARHKWISGAAREIAKAKTNLREAGTGEERAAALAHLIKWQQNKQAGLDALRERQQALSEVKVRESDTVGNWKTPGRLSTRPRPEWPVRSTGWVWTHF